jgi:tetratricopeptide (TPR) repeat protein
MTDDPRVDQLLEQLLDSGGTPDEVCRSCPELLPSVRAGWQQLRTVQAEVGELFPEFTYVGGRDAIPIRPHEVSASDLPHISGYEVREMLGRGGMGVVYKAWHLRLNRPVALKMLLAGEYAQPEELERFLREAETVASLRHPNIVQVHEVGDVGGRPYFTMEFIEGGSLAQKLAATPQPAIQTAVLVATVAEAMQVAHESGIIHRDLKPANILLTSEGNPKVTDFGLAQRLEGSAALTLTGAPLGTPSYMAPEQARSQRDAIGPATDVYALGAILYEMLTGRPPFRAESPAATVEQVLNREPVPASRLNATVPRDLETICLKCLEKDPARRYPSARAVAEDLNRFQRNEPIMARPVGSLERVLRWTRRKPTAAGLLAALVALFLLTVGGGLWLERQQAERRAETARQEERQSQAVQAALEKAATLQQQGCWPEAQAVLDGAQRLLADSSAVALVERVNQARADADMVTELEEIRLRTLVFPRSADPGFRSLEIQYAEAFRKYRIPLLTPEAPDAAARIRSSSIHETLLAYLHDWLSLASSENRTPLQNLLDRADNDDWRSAFREALVKKDTDKLNALAHAPETKTQPAVILSVLGGAMLTDKYANSALALLQEAQQHYPGDFWTNYQLGLFWNRERPREAVGYFRVAVAIRPASDQAYMNLGNALRDSDDAEGAIAAFRQCLALKPNYPAAKDLILALIQRGRLEDARAAWEKLLERDPAHHDPWYGYAELCLFLGRTDDYHSARLALLRRFGASTYPFDAERCARACLLAPATADELRQAVALAQRAVAVTPGDKWGEPYFQFVHGLAEYRQGQFDRAITTMRGGASSVLGPAPRLVLAMALHRSGRRQEARETFVKAILAHDWRPIQLPVLDPNGWIFHVLRREAESMLLPNLSAFLDGTYQPADNEERLALLGACQFLNRTHAIARLYTDAFSADPTLAENLDANYRYDAARAAALAGCGHGSDATGLGKVERKRWRDQARQWLHSDLAARARDLDTGSEAARRAVRLALTRWRNEPDLACVRDSDELKKLAEHERKEYLALWAEIAAVFARTSPSPGR